MFQHQTHLNIENYLKSINHSIFIRSECFLGGGYAISLGAGEYRRCPSLKFFCGSIEGYREIRSAIMENGLSAVIGGADDVNALRADQLGIRSVLRIEDELIPFEIRLTTHIPLKSHQPMLCPIDVLSPETLFVERLLAVSDATHDDERTAILMIDLGKLISYWGKIFEPSFLIAERAYGQQALNSFKAGVALIEDEFVLNNAFNRFSVIDMTSSQIKEALKIYSARV